VVARRAARRVCRERQGASSEAFGYDWLDNESMILGSGVAGTGLRVAAQAGGPLRELTKPEARRGEMYHTFPLTLPRGRVAFISWQVRPLLARRAGADRAC
jgi:hypothetical protein